MKAEHERMNPRHSGARSQACSLDAAAYGRCGLMQHKHTHTHTHTHTLIQTQTQTHTTAISHHEEQKPCETETDDMIHARLQTER